MGEFGNEHVSHYQSKSAEYIEVVHQQVIA
jgi:hypothetical protein